MGTGSISLGRGDGGTFIKVGRDIFEYPHDVIMSEPVETYLESVDWKIPEGIINGCGAEGHKLQHWFLKMVAKIAGHSLDNVCNLHDLEYLAGNENAPEILAVVKKEYKGKVLADAYLNINAVSYCMNRGVTRGRVAMIATIFQIGLLINGGSAYYNTKDRAQWS